MKKLNLIICICILLALLPAWKVSAEEVEDMDLGGIEISDTTKAYIINHQKVFLDESELEYVDTLGNECETVTGTVSDSDIILDSNIVILPPTVTDIRESVNTYNEAVRQNGGNGVASAEETLEETFDVDVQDYVEDWIVNTAADKAYDMSKDILKDEAARLLRDYVGFDLGEAGEFVDIADGAYEQYVNLINGLATLDEVAEAFSSGRPDSFIQGMVALGNTSSQLTGGNVVMDFNTMLWQELFETKEWNEFVEANQDHFGRAFVKATADGWKACYEHLPEEIGQIAQNISESFKKFGEKVRDWFEKTEGEQKPTSRVNVYKPNIYFYSDEMLEVNVKFEEEYLLTTTIPAYELGWDTVVHGDGTITCQGMEYDFLFYESLASRALAKKESGWIIYADTRKEQLLDVLEQYQFNEKESADFMEFWMEMLEENVDYVMYPQDTACVDLQMPMNVQPAPASVTRIWFGFEQYQEQLVEIPKVEPIARDGFTVVEWGGFFLDEE